MQDRTHWHIATGLAGYGPDGADGFGTAETLDDAAEYARDELRNAVDSCEEGADILAGEGRFEQAWNEHKRADRLEILRANIDPERQNAPLYKDRPEVWAETLSRILGEEFPCDISEHSRLYVWQCDDSECEHREDS